MRFENVPTSMERRREIFIEKQRRKYKSHKKISLTILNGENLNFSWILDTPSKDYPQEIYIGT